MMTLTEMSQILNLSKERTKQLVDAALLQDLSLPIDKSNKWILGEKLIQHILGERGKKIPKKMVITTKSAQRNVGGTTLLFEAAAYMSKFLKVLVIDTDPEAHVSKLLGPNFLDCKKTRCLYEVFSENSSLETAILQTKYSNIDIVPSTLRMHKMEELLNGQNINTILRSKIDDLQLNYNVIFVDIPPALGTKLVMSSYLAADLICLPCNPSAFSLQSASITIEAFEKICTHLNVAPKKFKFIFNRYDSNSPASQEGLSALLNQYNSLVIPNYIKQSAIVLNSLSAGKSVYEISGAKGPKYEFAALSLSMLDLI